MNVFSKKSPENLQVSKKRRTFALDFERSPLKRIGI